MHDAINLLAPTRLVLGDSLNKSDTDRFRKDDEWYFVWWKGKDEKV